MEFDALKRGAEGCALFRQISVEARVADLRSAARSSASMARSANSGSLPAPDPPGRAQHPGRVGAALAGCAPGRFRGPGRARSRATSEFPHRETVLHEKQSLRSQCARCRAFRARPRASARHSPPPGRRPRPRSDGREDSAGHWRRSRTARSVRSMRADIRAADEPDHRSAPHGFPPIPPNEPASPRDGRTDRRTSSSAATIAFQSIGTPCTCSRRGGGDNRFRRPGVHGAAYRPQALRDCVRQGTHESG